MMNIEENNSEIDNNIYQRVKEENAKAIKISSARINNSSKKRHLLIVSNQNTKQFPHDFFQVKEREIRSGDAGERTKKNLENSDYFDNSSRKYDKSSDNLNQNLNQNLNINVNPYSFIKPNAKSFFQQGKEIGSVSGLASGPYSGASTISDKSKNNKDTTQNMFDKYFPQPSSLKYNVISPSNHIGNDMNIIPEEDEKSIYNITGKKNFDFNHSSTYDNSGSNVVVSVVEKKKIELTSNKPIKFSTNDNTSYNKSESKEKQKLVDNTNNKNGNIINKSEIEVSPNKKPNFAKSMKTKQISPNSKQYNSEDNNKSKNKLKSNNTSALVNNNNNSNNANEQKPQLKINTNEINKPKSSEMSKSINNLQHVAQLSPAESKNPENTFKFPMQSIIEEKEINNINKGVKKAKINIQDIQTNNELNKPKYKQSNPLPAEQNIKGIINDKLTNLTNTNSKFYSNRELGVKNDLEELRELKELNPSKNININNINNNNKNSYGINNNRTLFKQCNVVDKNSSAIVKLPIINSNRSGSGGGKINLDIKNILNECGEYKEDPIIKKKLNNIMNDIVEINKVITTKTNNNKRIKISSAPTQPNTADNQDGSGNDEKIFTFSKFPQLKEIEKGRKISKNAEINLNNFNTKKFVKAETYLSKDKVPIKIKNDQFKLDTNSQIIKYNQKVIKLK